MKTMLLLLILVSFGGPAVSQEPWQQELKADLVKVRGAKFTYEEFGIYELKIPGFDPADVQTKVYAEAPATGVISRDNFIAIATVLSNTTLLVAFAEAYQVSASDFLSNFDFETLKTPIGKPDLEVNIYMTAEGYQLEVVNTSSGEKNRVTQTWKELYGN